MPSAYLWPYVAAITEPPWLPTIVYPATGIAGLWQAPPAPPETLERLMGRTRALVLTAVDQPLSTTALAALTRGPARQLVRDEGLGHGGMGIIQDGGGLSDDPGLGQADHPRLQRLPGQHQPGVQLRGQPDQRVRRPQRDAELAGDLLSEPFLPGAR